MRHHGQPESDLRLGTMDFSGYPDAPKSQWAEMVDGYDPVPGNPAALHSPDRAMTPSPRTFLGSRLRFPEAGVYRELHQAIRAGKDPWAMKMILRARAKSAAMKPITEGQMMVNEQAAAEGDGDGREGEGGDDEPHCATQHTISDFDLPDDDFGLGNESAAIIDISDSDDNRSPADPSPEGDPFGSPRPNGDGPNPMTPENRKTKVSFNSPKDNDAYGSAAKTTKSTKSKRSVAGSLVSMSSATDCSSEDKILRKRLGESGQKGAGDRKEMDLGLDFKDYAGPNTIDWKGIINDESKPGELGGSYGK